MLFSTKFFVGYEGPSNGSGYVVVWGWVQGDAEAVWWSDSTDSGEEGHTRLAPHQVWIFLLGTPLIYWWDICRFNYHCVVLLLCSTMSGLCSGFPSPPLVANDTDPLKLQIQITIQSLVDNIQVLYAISTMQLEDKK